MMCRCEERDLKQVFKQCLSMYETKQLENKGKTKVILGNVITSCHLAR